MSRITRLSQPVTGQGGVISKASIGLGNVDNTSDANKPISTATTSALAMKASVTQLNSAISALTKASVGLGNVDNTSDATKPLSTAATTALAGKVNTSLAVTKGDLIVALGPGVFGRLAIGNTGQALVVDPTTTTGFKFADAGGSSVKVTAEDHPTVPNVGVVTVIGGDAVSVADHPTLQNIGSFTA